MVKFGNININYKVAKKGLYIELSRIWTENMRNSLLLQIRNPNYKKQIIFGEMMFEMIKTKRIVALCGYI